MDKFLFHLINHTFLGRKGHIHVYCLLFKLESAFRFEPDFAELFICALNKFNRE